MRHNHRVYPQGAYWFKLLSRGYYVSGNNNIRKRPPHVFSEECDFVILWGIEENRFWVVPAAILDDKTLVVVGPDVAWVPVNMQEALRLRESGMTQREIADALGVTERTIGRRFEGIYITPQRSVSQRVRECEGRWDSLGQAVSALTGATNVVSENAVTTAKEDKK